MMGSHLKQLIRFGLVGLVNTAVAYLVFALFLFVGVHYTFATLLGGLAGMLVGFKLTGALVFNKRGNGRFPKYIAVFVLMYVLNIAIQRLLHPVFNPYTSGALATSACFLASFTLNRLFVFREHGESAPNSYDESYADIQIKRSRNRLRVLVRSFYLRDILRHVHGPAIDFGCGSGDLLARLPMGSMGLEINPHALDYCRARNLEVALYDPLADEYQLKDIPPGRFNTILFTHVLEHLEDPEVALKAIFRSCDRLGIRRVVLTVPCEKGYRFDPTHRTFVDEAYLTLRGLWRCEGFAVTSQEYFPLNWKWIGRYYTFHEWRVVFDRE